MVAMKCCKLPVTTVALAGDICNEKVKFSWRQTETSSRANALATQNVRQIPARKRERNGGIFMGRFSATLSTRHNVPKDHVRQLATDGERPVEIEQGGRRAPRKSIETAFFWQATIQRRSLRSASKAGNTRMTGAAWRLVNAIEGYQSTKRVKSVPPEPAPTSGLRLDNEWEVSKRRRCEQRSEGKV